MNKEDLMSRLKDETQVITTKELESAFTSIDRADFVPEDYKVEAYEDYALPIGFDQTISQPTTIAFMLELLNLEKGNEVLEVGFGSGYVVALLSKIVGPQGKIYGVEIIPELVKIATDNLKKYNFTNVVIQEAGDDLGLTAHSPFDRILVSAAAEEIPQELLTQLASPGVLVMPVQNSIIQVVKTADGKISKREFPGFQFVPLR